VKTPAERVDDFLRKHGNGMHEPDGPFAQALVQEVRAMLSAQRKAHSEAVNALKRTHPNADGPTLYLAYSAVINSPLIGEKAP
jgi:hypothetical protein